jgi:uncharacterized C2H2 Zn-finger protein
MADTKSFCCNVCNIQYKSYKSLWTHNKTKHEGATTIKSVFEKKESNCITFSCSTCDKVYKQKQTLTEHQKKCSGSKTIRDDIELEKIKIIALEKQQTILELKIKLLEMKKMDKNTFRAVNKVLMERSSTNVTNNTINNTNCVNNIIVNNNFVFPSIVKIGGENLMQTLTELEKRQILDCKYQSLEKMVELVHCGTRDDFKNIVITNLKDKFAYKYDSQKGFFVSIDKNVLLDELLLYRVLDLEAIYNELSTANKIDKRTKKIIQDFLDKLDDKSVYVEESVKYADFKAYKQSKIKILLYNNQDKITKDIASLLM